MQITHRRFIIHNAGRRFSGIGFVFILLHPAADRRRSYDIAMLQRTENRIRDPGAFLRFSRRGRLTRHIAADLIRHKNRSSRKRISVDAFSLVKTLRSINVHPLIRCIRR